MHQQEDTLFKVTFAWSSTPIPLESLKPPISSPQCRLQQLNHLGPASLGNAQGRLLKELTGHSCVREDANRKLGDGACYYSLKVLELPYVLNVLTLMILPAN